MKIMIIIDRGRLEESQTLDENNDEIVNTTLRLNCESLETREWLS